MADVQFDRVTLIYPGAAKPSVNNVSLDIADGEFLVLVGPSGSGKSTCLRMLAGLEEITAGRILIGGKDVTGTEPRQRDIAMVFQNYALYPHMTVAENMGFALKLAGKPKEFIKKKVDEAAQLLDLTPYLGRKPKELSGGQRQRVAMGRAIVREPAVFLMDEPLSNLDAKLRVQTRTQIASLQQQLGTTTVYVTHDQVEAMTLGDRVAVLADGELQQVAAPRELYDNPVNKFVAGFIGSPAMNFFDVPARDGIADFGGAKLPVSVEDGTISVGVRPEHLSPTSDTDRYGRGGQFPITVHVVEELGADAFAYGVTTSGEHVVARVDWRNPPAVGESLTLRADLEKALLFDASGARLRRPDQQQQVDIRK